MYKNDCELVLQRLSQHQTKDELTHPKESTKVALHQTVNLPQLPLPIFSGNPKEWRGFWSSFDAAKNDREWKTTVEAIERILRQLEAMGENLEQSSIEIIIENKLPVWILNKIYQQKEEQEPWSVTKLRSFLGKLVQRNEEVARSQSLNIEKDTKPIKNKPRSYLQHVRNETSALAITIPPREKTKDNFSSKKSEKTRRPCSFCEQDHWDNECHVYPTLKQRMERLRENNACLNCLQLGHKESNCSKRKYSCFHCKGSHNTALCPMKYKESAQRDKPTKEKMSIKIINPILNKKNPEQRDVLLLCKEVETINLDTPVITEKAVVLFDSGAQISCISKKLANRLKLREIDYEKMKITSFGDRNPKTSVIAKGKFGIITTDNQIVPITVVIVTDLTSQLRIIPVNQYDVTLISTQLPLEDTEGHWQKPDIIIGVD
ncbi:unnamed protein product [Onchocerca ochengi]|uniref:DUF1758 domain-containing protein n=1 Tax=Onchocerca ochengi TaxID=42157 RepID=A0A182ESI6_ONCOC|nr:unnamed protein product [Onchocerca ochengi]